MKNSKESGLSPCQWALRATSGLDG